MIRQLRYAGVTERVMAAMERVPRERFVPEEEQDLAYEDMPLHIGYNQTISAPSMVGIMCSILDIRDDSKVLEVGTGCGYHAAVMSLLASRGTVYTVERIPELAEKSGALLKELGYDNVKVITGDGSEGLPDYAPYDRISVAAAAPDVPDALVEELADPGSMVLPVGRPFMQELYLVEKKNGKVETYQRGGVAFVPLVGKGGFRGD